MSDSDLFTNAGVEFVDYEPPPPVFNDALLSFAALPNPWRNPPVSVVIAPDPLGPVNSIVSLVVRDAQGDRRIAPAVLYPISAGVVVTLGQEGSLYPGFGWSAFGSGDPEPHRPRVWYVTVDDRRILEVPWSAALPLIRPVPPAPLWRRIRQLTARHARSVADGVAGRLGYHRDDEFGGDQ